MAVRNTITNVNALRKIPGLCNELQETVTNAFKELQETVKEYNEARSRAAEIKQACNEKGKETPKECYLECGKEIEETPELIKRWEKMYVQTGQPKKVKKAGSSEEAEE